MKLHLLFLTAFCVTLAASLPVETPTDSEDAKLCSEPITTACIETDENCDKEKLSTRKKRETICPALIAECVMRQQQCLQECLYKATENCDETCPVCPSAIYPHFPHLEPDKDSNIEPMDMESFREALEELEGEGEPPRPLIKRNLIIEGNNETHYYKGYLEPFSNITTIIRLTNIINNTNEINMPTTVNNTNVNNVHIFNNKSSETGGNFGMGYTKEGSCCFKVQPKSCTTSTSGPRCHHKRSKVCGEQCTARIIHAKREHADKTHNGQQGCHSIPNWPYVHCPGHNQGPPMQSFQQPMQGYQQPYYGYQPYYPQMMPMNPMLPPSVDPNSSPGIFEEDDDELFEPADFPDFDEQDDTEWGVVSEKCKVVSEDGISIKNCTDSNKNPYAGTPVNPPRVQRQAAIPYYPQQMMPAPIYYVMPQPMYQPVYYPPPRQQKNSDYYEDNSGPDDSQIYNENTKFHKRHQTIQDDY